MDESRVRSNNKGILLEDIRSNFKTKGEKVFRLLGGTGETVDIISQSGDVFIVQGKDFFPVHKSKIKISNIKP